MPFSFEANALDEFAKLCIILSDITLIGPTQLLIQGW